MPGMRDEFEHFYPLGDAAVGSAMRTGLVVPDTNVLFGLYRLQAKARGELLKSLENLGNTERLWIPHQVGFEYHRNRLGVIADQEQFFRKTSRDLDASMGAVRKDVRAFQTRLALGKDDLQEVTDSIDALQKLLQRKVTETKKANEVRLKDRDSDPVLARLERLFDGCVGRPMEPDVLVQARAEAARRGRDQIPPGYKDADKDTGDPAGDYLVWRQLMTEAKTRGLPVVFITDDTKPDWYRFDQDIPLGARYELREEIKREAGVSTLLMMTTEDFIGHAEKYLNDKFSEETREQAKELPAAVRREDLLEALLEQIASGQAGNRTQLTLTMRALRTELGSTEMERRVVEAILEGKVSGNLSREDSQAVADAMSREILIGRDAEPTRRVNPTLPILRDAFERALEVSPGDDDPDTVARARRTIAMNLERRQVTDDDKERARAWLEQYNQQFSTQDSESQEEPPVWS